jgi:hypothetical protein
VAHRGLIGDASALAATEKPDPVAPPSIEDARWAVAFGAREHEVTPTEMRFSPVADDGLPYRLQWFAAGGPAGKFQYQPLRIRPTVHLKPDGAVQPTASTKFQLPLTGQFMDVKPRALHVAKLAL